MAHILSTASTPVEIRVDIFVKPIVARRRKKENSDGLSRYNIPDESPAAPNRRSAMVEVTLEKVYYSKLKFTIVNGTVSVPGIFQFTMVNFTLVNFHDYCGKNKDDPSPITI